MVDHEQQGSRRPSYDDWGTDAAQVARTVAAVERALGEVRAAR